ncbi:hypothetical protein RhiTH_006350 [Rhizoctonia solani]|nr:hypothetical protein RHS01_04418 [Rhizoctonia solani]
MPSYAASTTSTTSLVHHQQPRDYSAAFGNLASSYGASGTAPSRPSSKTASHLNAGASSRSDTSTKRWRSIFSKQPLSSNPAAEPEKYVVPKSQDFGALINKYGAKSAPTASLL